MNPQHPDLESGALPLELLASQKFQVPGSMSRAPQQSTRNLKLGTVLLGFLMGGVLAAPTTVLTQFDPIRRILFILRRCVISPFAFTTS